MSESGKDRGILFTAEDLLVFFAIVAMIAAAIIFVSFAIETLQSSEFGPMWVVLA